MKLHFEKDLEHQKQATEAVINVFKGVPVKMPDGPEKQSINPEFLFGENDQYARNILNIQNLNSIDGRVQRNSDIVDIMMETGTGKTYTYTKTIFELNKYYGIFKFIIVVPTLAIKAGTINFLKSDGAREHFKEIYGKTINLHIVESLKSNKSKKAHFPPAVASFASASNFDKSKVEVLIINAGMINSKTMEAEFDKSLFDKYNVPFDALASVKPFVIVDEPHRFGQSNTTWQNIQKMKPQFILRYGATFQEYENLVYTLTAVDAFNRNLVKGVTGHIIEFKKGKNTIVRLKNIEGGKEASFELKEENKKAKTYKLIQKESLARVHHAMEGLFIEKMNKTTVLLSNGLELKKGDKINPYSYEEKLQEQMIKKAVKNHFEIERELLKRDPRIKPLTLFFIDNIDEYRERDGYLRETLEQSVKKEIEQILKEEKDQFYKRYLEKTLEDLSKTHGGYFSEDNTGKDEEVEKEINEILHDKKALLDLNNPRRFIFSKWTLREGWDNPNVFQICKLRSSGSEISKLQEVGRGLRLPVNEYGNRVKDEQFYLHYFVDFTESDFVEKLRKEINGKSGAFSIDEVPEKLTEEMINKICEVYDLSEEELLEKLDEENVITRSNKFKDGGFEYIKKSFPLIFVGVDRNKVRKANEKPNKVTVRIEKYPALKELWEKLNEKVILEYKVKNEKEFKKLFFKFVENLKREQNIFNTGVQERVQTLATEGNKVDISNAQTNTDTELMSIGAQMKYGEFLKELSKALSVNIKTLHEAFVEAKFDINPYLNQTAIRAIERKFRNYLLENTLTNLEISFKKVKSSIHPTKLTDTKGNVLKEIPAFEVGRYSENQEVATSYLFNELFFDSELERKNITTDVQEVVVFTKIPKNSIKIPVVGGKSYSPDFAYVVNYKGGGKKLYFVVETKDVEGEGQLRREEEKKIKLAEHLLKDSVKIKFKTQFSDNEIVDLIREVTIGF